MLEGLNFSALRNGLRRLKNKHRIAMMMALTDCWLQQDVLCLQFFEEAPLREVSCVFPNSDCSRTRKRCRSSLSQMLCEFLSPAVKKKCKADKDLLKAFAFLPRFPAALYDELLGLCLAFVQTSTPQRSESVPSFFFISFFNFFEFCHFFFFLDWDRSLMRMTLTQGHELLDWRSGWLNVFKKTSSFSEAFCIIDEDAHILLGFYCRRLRPIAGKPNLPSPRSNALVFTLVRACAALRAHRSVEAALAMDRSVQSAMQNEGVRRIFVEVCLERVGFLDRCAFFFNDFSFQVLRERNASATTLLENLNEQKRCDKWQDLKKKLASRLSGDNRRVVSGLTTSQLQYFASHHELEHAEPLFFKTRNGTRLLQSNTIMGQAIGKCVDSKENVTSTLIRCMREQQVAFPLTKSFIHSACLSCS